ncbi:MAG: Asp-tRNA(Asn)/Glu-tRNA(Gln) amidotransferase subunit GatC [Alkalispirochaetaceae bacterium]
MDAQELAVTADLAYLDMAEGETDKLIAAVDQLVSYFEKMNEVDVSDLEPTTHALLAENRTRPDKVRESAFSDDMLENAPDLEGRFIVIPNVL